MKSKLLELSAGVLLVLESLGVCGQGTAEARLEAALQKNKFIAVLVGEKGGYGKLNEAITENRNAAFLEAHFIRVDARNKELPALQAGGKRVGLTLLDPEGNFLVQVDTNRSSAVLESYLKAAVLAVNRPFFLDLAKVTEGKLSTGELLTLLTNSSTVVNDPKLVEELTRKFWREYFEPLSSIEQLKKQYLSAIYHQAVLDQLLPKDRLFILANTQAGLLDSALGADGVALSLLKAGLKNAYLYPKGVAMQKLEPEWLKLEKFIGKNYPKVDAAAFLLDERIAYYLQKGDWQNYARYQSLYFEHHPPVTAHEAKKGLLDSDSWRLNLYAWNLFKQSGDKKVLEQALRWSDQSILLIQPEVINQFLDTKANLLYRLGRVKEALVWQEIAIRATEKDDELNSRTEPTTSEYVEVLELMKKGLPTWPVKK